MSVYCPLSTAASENKSNQAAVPTVPTIIRTGMPGIVIQSTKPVIGPCIQHVGNNAYRASLGTTGSSNLFVPSLACYSRPTYHVAQSSALNQSQLSTSAVQQVYADISPATSFTSGSGNDSIYQPSPAPTGNISRDQGDLLEDPQIDIVIRNVVACFSTRCHLDLQKLTYHMCHVMFDRSKGCVVKQMRKPACFIKIWSQGKVSIAGLKTEADAKRAARRLCRHLKDYFPRVRLCQYRVANIMATCKMPFGVRIQEMAGAYPKEAKCARTKLDKLLHKALHMHKPKGTVRVHTTGSCTVTGATSVDNVSIVLETLYPILLKFRSTVPPVVSLGGKRPAKQGAFSVAAKHVKASASQSKDSPMAWDSPLASDDEFDDDDDEL